MKVKMHTLAAGPERILHPGEVYDLPKSVATGLLEARDLNGAPFASVVDRSTPAKKLPPQPDPQDNPAVGEDDDGWENTGDGEE